MGGERQANSEKQADEQRAGEQCVDDRRLDLDEMIVLQIEGQAAEHEDARTGDERHHGNASEHEA